MMLPRALPLLLLLLPHNAVHGRHRPWSLPALRLGSQARLVDGRDLSSSLRSHHQPSLALGLAGGEAAMVPEDDNTSNTNTEKLEEEQVGEDANNLEEDSIARGGGATKDASATTTEKEAEPPTTSKAVEVVTAETSKKHDEGEKPKGLKKLLPKKKDKFHKKLAKKLRNRNVTNKRRKFMHASFGFLFASLNQFIPKEKFVLGMATLSSATLLMELLRYRQGFGWMNHTLHFFLGKALRKNEMDGKFTGSFYFFTGVTLTAYLYPTTCATMGILQLALADPSASYFGRATRHVYWSRIENGLGGFGRNKGLLGFLGGALFCFPFNYRILSIAKFGAEGMPGGKTSLAAASLALGIAGAFADLAVPTPAWTLPKHIYGVRVPPLHVDDNFVVPIFSGFACTQIFKALKWDQNLALAALILA